MYSVSLVIVLFAAIFTNPVLAGYRYSTKVSKCLISLDPKVVDFGLGYSIGASEVFGPRLKLDVRDLMRASALQSRIKYKDNDEIPTLVHPFVGFGSVRLDGNRIRIRWSEINHVSKRDQKKFRRVARRLVRYSIDLLVQSIPEMRERLNDWQEILLNSIRYYLEPGVESVGLAMHRDPRAFQMIVEFERPAKLQNGSLQIWSGSKKRNSETMGPELLNRGVLIGGQSNFHGVQDFDMWDGKMGDPVEYRDVLSLSISPPQTGRVRLEREQMMNQDRALIYPRRF